MKQQAVARAALVLLVGLAFAATIAGGATAGDHHHHKNHNHHNQHQGSFNVQPWFGNLQQFDQQRHKVGKPSQVHHQPKQVKPYLNPQGSSDHPPHASGWWLGVSTQAFGRGPEVQFVSHGSPASRVGIEQGDIIHEVDGIPVSTPWELSQAIRFSDGYVRLLIEDVRTGDLAYRMVRLTRRVSQVY
ncbi:MAG: PDZ domain-containing protein [Pirellulales bacterium]|nr:PDZ domain-containing protein [Pirellulales bacterium]